MNLHVDPLHILIGLMFLCSGCGIIIGYFAGVLNSRPPEEDDPPDWPEPEGDFDGGYAAMHEPRRLTRLTSRTTEN